MDELWDGMSLLAERRFELGPVPGRDAAGRPRPPRPGAAQPGRQRDRPHRPGSAGWCACACRRLPGERIRFLVEDDGPGIPPDQRERVFHRFHRTDSARSRASGGTGLGLAIVRAIADAHGGSVSAGASPEGGARIELELPGFTAAHGGPAPTAQAVRAPGERPEAAVDLDELTAR